METAPDTSTPPFIRRMNGAARMLGAMSGALLGAGRSAAEDFQLRCATFALIAGFMTCGFFGCLMLVSQEWWQAIFLLGTAGLYVGCIVFHRRRHETVWTLNAMAASTWLCIVLLMVLQGGAHTPTSWWLITLSYLLATAGLPRSSLAWLAVCALTVLGFLWLEAQGVPFPRHFGASPLLFEFASQVGLFGLIIFFALVLSAARVDSTRRAEDAYQAALAASAAKSRFLATMSHEIRTPLNGVIGAAELLSKTEVRDEQRQLLDTLHYSGVHLRGLIDDILDFSRIEAGKLELEHADFDPAYLIRQTVAGFGISARGKGLAVECHIAPTVPALVRGDAARLRQILSNLMANAIKFTHAGGVDIEVTAADDAPAGGSRLVIRVRDTGIGIERDKLQRLFKPFSQTDDSTTRLYGGSGLGLAISQELARRMQGDIAVESAIGTGTTFTATLAFGSAAAPAMPAAAPAAAGDADALPAGLHVLLVEDNPVNLTLGVAMLEQLGCAVQTAENGAEGVARWRSDPPALVLLDCHMPVMDGLTAAREIRLLEGDGPHTPIVALSASAFAEDRAACLAAGMNDFLSKPYTFQQLSEIVLRYARRDDVAALPPGVVG